MDRFRFYDIGDSDLWLRTDDHVIKVLSTGSMYYTHKRYLRSLYRELGLSDTKFMDTLRSIDKSIHDELLVRKWNNTVSDYKIILDTDLGTYYVSTKEEWDTLTGIVDSLIDKDEINSSAYKSLLIDTELYWYDSSTKLGALITVSLDKCRVVSTPYKLLHNKYYQVGYTTNVTLDTLEGLDTSVVLDSITSYLVHDDLSWTTKLITISDYERVGKVVYGRTRRSDLSNTIISDEDLITYSNLSNVEKSQISSDYTIEDVLIRLCQTISLSDKSYLSNFIRSYTYLRDRYM